MPESSYCILPHSIIPLPSGEPLWEWAVSTDELYLSEGLIKQLRLGDNVPLSMEQYLALLPPDAVSELKALRETALSGETTNPLEASYLCNGLWVHEYLMVLMRNCAGRATRVIGRLSVESVRPEGLGFAVGQDLQENGLWVYDVPKRRAWQDATCALLMGAPSDQQHAHYGPIDMNEIHESDREALARHYKLFIEGTFIGDNISDIVRVRRKDGRFTPMLLRAAALERDTAGKALLIAGTMTPEGNEHLHQLNKDDRLFHALHSLGAGQWNWDPLNDTVCFCPRYLSMLGYDPDNAPCTATGWHKRVHPDDRGKLIAVQEATIASPKHGDSYECTYRLQRADGGWAWIFDRGCVIWRDAQGRAAHMVGSITNITTAQADRERLEELVRQDSLTGLRSRASSNLEIEHIEQNGIRPVTVIVGDVTGLKMINDNLGHAVGDELLTKAASLLRGSLRSSDCVARMGGDEFMVLLPNCDEERGRKLLEKIECTFADYNNRPGRECDSSQKHLPVFSAFGIASTDDPKKSLETLLAEADKDMLANKKEHRAHFHARLRDWILDHTGKEVGADDRVVEI